MPWPKSSTRNPRYGASCVGDGFRLIGISSPGSGSSVSAVIPDERDCAHSGGARTCAPRRIRPVAHPSRLAPLAPQDDVCTLLQLKLLIPHRRLQREIALANVGVGLQLVDVSCVDD